MCSQDAQQDGSIPSKLTAGTIYSPPLEGQSGEALTSPKARVPCHPRPHRLLETPFSTALKLILDEAVNRPVTVYQKQRSAMSWIFEALLFPLVLVVTAIVGILRSHYGLWWDPFVRDPATEGFGPKENKDSVWEVYLSLPFCVVLPLLPIVVPSVWTLINAICTAVILCLHASVCANSDSISCSMATTPASSDPPSEDIPEGSDSDHLCPPRAPRGPPSTGASSGHGAASDIPRPGEVSLPSLLRKTISLLQGNSPSCVRSSNISHVLASVTDLCCVDKKGILSWTNPTPEKIFFLKTRPSVTSPSGTAPGPVADDKGSSKTRFTTVSSVGSLPAAGEDEVFKDPNATVESQQPPQSFESEPVLLSLTHTHATPFAISFDDPVWRNSLDSLKPLGLSILLNTCNPRTRSHYSTFSGHITNEASYTQDLVPVSQRRCLCALTQLMGFSSSAPQPFTLEHQVSVFRQVPSEFACRERYSRSLLATKLKFPFPHMLGVLMRDHATQKLELLTQGTADIVLDSCSDFWDGTDICPLTDKDRKKLLDFYHRTCLSAYCTAFSYRPSPCVVNTDINNMYMELPSDPTHLYTRSPTPHNSTEALFGDEAHTEYEQVDDIDDIFRLQCKQIFIGMVTMQYQAKPDMVQMLEHLDGACIRFVHFSKENELRSRVFSEKMGLESGWNCHISLLDDPRSDETCNSSLKAGGPSAVVLPPLSTASGISIGRDSTDNISRCPSAGTSATPARIKPRYLSIDLHYFYFWYYFFIISIFGTIFLFFLFLVLFFYYFYFWYYFFIFSIFGTILVHLIIPATDLTLNRLTIELILTSYYTSISFLGRFIL